MKKALIFYGGWNGHEPYKTSFRFKSFLEKSGFNVDFYDTLDCLKDEEKLKALDLIVPCWTMGELSDEYSVSVSNAIGSGVGLAGWHGGMCDAFRTDTRWQFMTGGQWVSHPGGDNIEYTVNINHGSSSITEGIEDFPVKSEHYYLHIDPSVEVLATTRFPCVPYYHISNKPVDMPVVWTKYWGHGRVFYSSLGHKDKVFADSPAAQTLMERGLLWAAAGKDFAVKNKLTVDRFLNDAQMY